MRVQANAQSWVLVLYIYLPIMDGDQFLKILKPFNIHIFPVIIYYGTPCSLIAVLVKDKQRTSNTLFAYPLMMLKWL